MALTISLPPELEAQLQKRAAAAGKDISSFVREAMQEKLTVELEDDVANPSPAQGTAEWFARLNEWVAGHPPRPHLADDSRDAIYSEEPD